MTKVAILAALALFAGAGAARADGDAARGESLFNRCSACHTLSDQNRVGPTLAGVFGRAAGSVPGARYSAAMQQSGLVWDAATLDAYLAAPRALVPGTIMAFALPDAADRADVIAYLMTVPAP